MENAKQGQDAPSGQPHDLRDVAEKLRLMRTTSLHQRYSGKPAPALPSRFEIMAILTDVIGVLYPRHHGPAGLHPDEVDGYVDLTLPLIRDNVQTAYIYLGIMALDAYVYMVALNATGGPGNSTLVMSQYLFRTAFEKGQFGLASAMGVVLAVITLIFAALVFLVNRLTGGKDDGGRG